ncbi:MAG: hypothetical protein GY711_18125 [bacterium]|nr:hypothetical protein [bacterium]
MKRSAITPLALFATVSALSVVFGGIRPPAAGPPVLHFGHTTASQAALSTNNLDVAGFPSGLSCPPAGTAADRCQVNTKVVSEGAATVGSSFVRNIDYNLVRFKKDDVYGGCSSAGECGGAGGKEVTSEESFRIDFQILRYFHNSASGPSLPPSGSRHAVYAADESDEEGDYILIDGNTMEKIDPAPDGTFSIVVPLFEHFVGEGSSSPPPSTLTGHFLNIELIRNAGSLEEPYEEVWVQIVGAEFVSAPPPHPPIGWNSFCRWVIVDRP